jgi:hypothetical protein
MKLGLRSLFGLGKKKRRHGDVPAPRRVATSYAGGHEIQVYETMAGYKVRVDGHWLPGGHATIREANSAGRSHVETRAAAYTRGTRGTRRAKRRKR